MKKYNFELIVGLFVLAGLLCVGYLTIKLGKMEFFSDNAYTLYANFNSVSGLRNGANIELAGVPVGKVAGIAVNEDKMTQARVTLHFKKELRLSSDTMAKIKTSGLIGDKYISLMPGRAAALLKNGDTLRETESPVDIEALISGFISGGASMEGLNDRGVTLHARFSSVAGLNTGATVRISGVQVGKVSAIELDSQDHNSAMVTMLIDPDVPISDDVIASIKSSSLIGGKYINLSQGASETMLADGGEITDTEASVDLEALISKYVFGGVK